jgi:hypothetical protein
MKIRTAVLEFFLAYRKTERQKDFNMCTAGMRKRLKNYQIVLQRRPPISTVGSLNEVRFLTSD